MAGNKNWKKWNMIVIWCIILIGNHEAESRTKKPKCSVCEAIRDKFLEGLEKTAKSNFGGGNTRWEEKSLGSYQFSETRLIEITENLCSTSDHDCHNFIEEWEERIEHWWFKLFAKGKEQNLYKYLCVDLTNVCCDGNTWGPKCEPCPGNSEKPCGGNGKCNGAGTREGTGKCDCHSGYEGDLCDDCKEGYYEQVRNDTHLICESCHTACDGGCHKEGLDGCHDCKKGWRQNTDDACEDIDECEGDEENKLCSDGQFCRNSPGSFECEACDTACEGCTGFGPSQCVECKPTHFKDGPTCKACHQSCASSCTGPGPEACTECGEGYVKNEEGICSDVNECDAEEAPCASDEYCSNNLGSYDCKRCPQSCTACSSSSSCTKCAPGYQMNTEQNNCQDVDECLLEEKACKGEREKCVNNEGSFTCTCMKGYVRRGNKCERKQKVAVSYDKEACEICKDIIDNFKKGFERTGKHNFGGGNTQWEEKKLGVYATSETRLVEIMEDVCTDVDKDCNRMMEHNEKFLEQWWFKHYAAQKDTDLFNYFCINRVEGACCPNGTYGPACTACPGGDNICSGHGECEGDGKREGSGKCNCDAGYTDDTCGSCDQKYYEDKSSESFTCEKCDESCDESCSGAGPQECDSCKEGWEEKETQGCTDIDECTSDPNRCKDNQYCSNTVGSYSCEGCNSACTGCTGAGSDSCKECAENYYQEGSSCKECHSSCDGCNGGGPSHCKQCRSGWTLQNNICTDINECQAEEGPCEKNKFCVNSLGSYRCHTCHNACNGCTSGGPSKCLECASGYAIKVEGERASCADVDECSQGAVCLEEGQSCSNTVGSYKCNCADGYIKKDGGCIKKKEKASPSTKGSGKGSSKAAPKTGRPPKLPKDSKKKSKRKSNDRSSDHIKYVVSLVGFAMVGSMLKRSWLAQLVFTSTFWIYLYWFSLRFEKRKAL